jgi:hypothetical protein
MLTAGTISCFKNLYRIEVPVRALRPREHYAVCSDNLRVLLVNDANKNDNIAQMNQTKD